MTRQASLALALLIPFCLCVLALAPHASTAGARTFSPEALEANTAGNSPRLYEVDMFMIREDAGRLPRVGSVIERPSHPAFVARVIAPLEESLMTGATHERTYVAGWQPVVGDGVVGYHAEVQTASEGVEFHLELVPAARADHVYVHFEGGMRQVNMRTIESNMTPPIELPTYSSMSLNGQLAVGAGRMYVIAAMTAEGMGSWYVAISATPLTGQ